MPTVVINYDTGKIVSGKIEKPPLEWLAREYFIPAIRREIEKDREKGA